MEHDSIKVARSILNTNANTWASVQHAVALEKTIAASLRKAAETGTCSWDGDAKAAVDSIEWTGRPERAAGLANLAAGKSPFPPLPNITVEVKGVQPRPGDVITVRGTVASIAESGAIMLKTKHLCPAPVHPNSVVSIEPRPPEPRPPEPIKVGDTVMWTCDPELRTDWNYIGTVRAIAKDKAWVRVEGAKECDIIFRCRDAVRPLTMLRVTRS